MSKMRNRNLRGVVLMQKDFDRRRFLKLLALFSIAGSSLVTALSAQSGPGENGKEPRKTYPGRIKPIDMSEIAKPGHWAG